LVCKCQCIDASIGVEIKYDLNVVVARKWHINMVDLENMEDEPPFEGNGISGSNQRFLLEVYLGNNKTQKWTKLSSWTPLRLYMSCHYE